MRFSSSTILTSLLMFSLLALLAIPSMCFAGGFADKVKVDIIPIITTICSVVFGGGLLAKIRVLGKAKKAINEAVEAVHVIKDKVTDPEAKKEVNEALFAVADVLDELKLGSAADKMRNAKI